MIRLCSCLTFLLRSLSQIRPRDMRAQVQRTTSAKAGRLLSSTSSWNPCRAAHTLQSASSADSNMIVLPGSLGSRRQRARSRLRSDRISARWMRSTSPERCAAASRSRFAAAVPPCLKPGRPAAHPGRLAALAQSVQRRAARHLTVRPIAESCATDHEVMALFRGLKSGDATGSWVSPTFIRVHAVSSRCATRADCIMTQPRRRRAARARRCRHMLGRLNIMDTRPRGTGLRAAASDAGAAPESTPGVIKADEGRLRND